MLFLFSLASWAGWKLAGLALVYAGPRPFLPLSPFYSSMTEIMAASDKIPLSQYSPLSCASLLALQSSSGASRRALLQDFLSLPSQFSPEESSSNQTRMEIYTDLLMRLLDRCWSLGFGALEISSLVGIFISLHWRLCDGGDLTENFQWLQEELIRRSIDRPPFSIGLFSPVHTDFAISWAEANYFRFARHLKFVFQRAPTLEIQINSFAPDSLVLEPLELAVESEAAPLSVPQPEVVDSSESAAVPAVAAPSSPSFPSSSSSQLDAVLSRAISDLNLQFEARLAAQQESFNKRISQITGE